MNMQTVFGTDSQRYTGSILYRRDSSRRTFQTGVLEIDKIQIVRVQNQLLALYETGRSLK